MPAENGFVPTPPRVADYAARALFGRVRPDDPDTRRLLLPGLGTGRLYDAVRRYCTEGAGWPDIADWSFPVPECVGVETAPDRITEFDAAHPDAEVDVRHQDFLLDPPADGFSWALLNPPYTRYQRLDAETRDVYRDRYWAASGQFGLYVPFVEAAIRAVNPGGEVVAIVPTPALAAPSNTRFRELMRRHLGDVHVKLPEDAFDARVRTAIVVFRKHADWDGTGNVYVHGVDRWEYEVLAESNPRLEASDAGWETYVDRLDGLRSVVWNRARADDGVDVEPASESGSSGGGRQAGLGEWA